MMRIYGRLQIVFAATAMLQVGGGEAAAQLELGGGASVSNVQGGTFGLGGRLGFPIRTSTRFGIRLEGQVGYYWPSCSVVDCSAVGTQVDVILQNRFAGQAAGYLGFGGTYQSYTLQRGNETVEDVGSWGVDFVAGSRYAGQTTLRPFVEMRWTIMDEISNQWAFLLGATVDLGRL